MQFQGLPEIKTGVNFSEIYRATQSFELIQAKEEVQAVGFERRCVDSRSWGFPLTYLRDLLHVKNSGQTFVFLCHL